MNIEHPDITRLRNSGYPLDYSEPEPYRCPVCNAIVEEYVYLDRDQEIFGCDRCVTTKEYYELGGN